MLDPFLLIVIVAELITSEHNPLLKDVRKAASKGSLTLEGFALAEGIHLLEEAVRSRLEIGVVIAAGGLLETVEAMLTRDQSRIVSVSEKLFAGLSSTDTPKGVLALVRLREWAWDDLKGSNPLILILDGVQDPGNAGAMVRSAEAFGATGVLLLKNSVHAHNPKAIRGSSGSLFRMPLMQTLEASTALDFLKTNNIALYAATPRAKESIGEVDWTRACALAIGSEGHGLSQPVESAARAVRIPTTGVESLNAAVSAAVMLYEAQRQRKAA